MHSSSYPIRYPLLKAHSVPSHFEELTLKEAEVITEVWANGEPTPEQLINNEPLKEFRQRLQAVIRKVVFSRHMLAHFVVLCFSAFVSIALSFMPALRSFGVC